MTTSPTCQQDAVHDPVTCSHDVILDPISCEDEFVDLKSTLRLTRVMRVLFYWFSPQESFSRSGFLFKDKRTGVILCVCTYVSMSVCECGERKDKERWRKRQRERERSQQYLDRLDHIIEPQNLQP